MLPPGTSSERPGELLSAHHLLLVGAAVPAQGDSEALFARLRIMIAVGQDVNVGEVLRGAHLVDGFDAGIGEEPQALPDEGQTLLIRGLRIVVDCFHVRPLDPRLQGPSQGSYVLDLGHLQAAGLRGKEQHLRLRVKTTGRLPWRQRSSPSPGKDWGARASSNGRIESSEPDSTSRTWTNSDSLARLVSERARESSTFRLGMRASTLPISSPSSRTAASRSRSGTSS